MTHNDFVKKKAVQYKGLLILVVTTAEFLHHALKGRECNVIESSNQFVIRLNGLQSALIYGERKDVIGKLNPGL